MGTLLASQQQGNNPNPLLKMDYSAAFDQSKIYVKFAPLLESIEGVPQNLGLLKKKVIQKSKHKEKKSLSNESQSTGYFSILSSSKKYLEDTFFLKKKSFLSNNSTNESYQEHPMWPLFKKEVFQKVTAERRYTLLQPAYEGLSMMTLFIGSMAGVSQAIGSDSFGGSFGVFAAAANSVWFMRDVIQSGYNWYHPPSSPLDPLEQEFAISKCFIPKDLWPMIIKKFMMGRQNIFEQQNSIDFIEFSLGLKVYEPLPLLNCPSVQQKVQNVWNCINLFFKDYEINDFKEISLIRSNVSLLIQGLLNPDTPKPRYLYIQGVGGVGKTRFAKDLCKWVNEELHSSLHFEDISVTDVQDLEGTTDRPGLFLKVLRNQTIDRKRASVVIMDEATFLNKEDFTSSCKRVFNGSLATLSTAYFGSGAEGTGIKLKMPHTLTILASNEPIKDEALRSRFDIIAFPKPKKKALSTYGKNLIEERIPFFPSLETLEDKKLEDFFENLTTFREVEQKINELSGE